MIVQVSKYENNFILYCRVFRRFVVLYNIYNRTIHLTSNKVYLRNLELTFLKIKLLHVKSVKSLLVTITFLKKLC